MLFSYKNGNIEYKTKDVTKLFEKTNQIQVQKTSMGVHYARGFFLKFPKYTRGDDLGKARDKLV